MSWFCQIKLEAHGGLLASKTVNIMCRNGTNLTYLWFCRNVQSHHLCQVTGMSDGHALANHGSHLVTGGQFFCSVFPEFKPLYIGWSDFMILNFLILSIAAKSSDQNVDLLTLIDYIWTKYFMKSTCVFAGREKVRGRERGRRRRRAEWGVEIKREEDKSEIRGSNTDEHEAGRTMERSMESKIDGKQTGRQRERETRGRKSQLVWLIWVSCRSLGLRPEGSPTSSRTWRLCSRIHEEIHNVSERPTWRAAAVLPTPTGKTQTHTTSSNTHTHVEIKAHTGNLHTHTDRYVAIYTNTHPNNTCTHRHTQRVRDAQRTCWFNI